MPLVKHYHMTTEEDDNKLKTTYKSCNSFVTCSVSNGELLYITFSHASTSTIELYPEYIFSRIILLSVAFQN